MCFWGHLEYYIKSTGRLGEDHYTARSSQEASLSEESEILIIIDD